MAGAYFLSLLIFIFPGYVLLSVLWKTNPFSFWEKVGISSALSLAVYPLLHLWLYVVGVSPGQYLAWGVVGVSVVVFFWIQRKKLFSVNKWNEAFGSLQKGTPWKKFLFIFLFLVVLGCLVISRICILKDMTGPAWGDATNHVTIVQLFRDHGGLFQSWAPYAPIESFSYHFGFHAAAAAWAEIGGISSAQAVLMAGQIFNVLAVLVLFPLVKRLTGSKWAALGGMVFAGLVFPFPGFFVNWSRYTQLTAQVILPVVFLFLFLLSREKFQLPLGFWVLCGILFIFLFLVVLGCLVISRICILKDMTGPAWGDATNHVTIVQLFRDHGGLFQSWAPYAPIESFSYHFGFHSVVSLWAELAGISSPQAVLTAGQIFNVLAVLALYPLVLRVVKNKWAALGGMVFAGLVFPFPGFFVNWSRCTQLTAQVILPVVFLFLFLLSREKFQLPLGFWVLCGVLFTGLAFAHYRVAFLGAAAFLAWFFWSLWEKRKSLSLWFKRWAHAGLVVLGSFSLMLPWMLHVWQSRMFDLSGLKGDTSSEAFYKSHFYVWKNIDFYFSDIFWIGGLLILILGMLLKKELAFPVLGWGIFSFIAANPRFMGFAGVGVLPNEILVFAMYIPLALLFGWVIGMVWKWLLKDRWGVPVMVLLTVFLMSFGMRRQLTVVDPFFQMLFPEDLKAFEWISKNVPEDAFFLVNGFVMKNWNTVAGSDSGWWLPYYTQRESTVPPALYAVHELKPGIDREMYSQIVRKVEESEGRADVLRKVLCKYGITHVFLGSKRGGTAYERDSRLIPETWLRDNKDFQLVFQEEKAQVWAFDR